MEDGTTGHPGGAHAADDQASRLGQPAPTATHVPPRITRLGTIAELTLGSEEESNSDATFPGSLFHEHS
jgi:hypothetical protein